ncbi:unnamed protein product [Heterobilharzia americana]|nr:unnamed protein product [Heterobilharzia americana]
MQYHQKKKGAYVYNSLPLNTPYRQTCRESITTMNAGSNEDATVHYEVFSRKRFNKWSKQCSDVRDVLSKQRAATARRVSQEKRDCYVKGRLIGSGCIDFNRSSVPIQTELYLEELTEIIEQDDFSTQTDAFLSRPSTPIYVPAKTSIDIETQIYENDLFNFDLEVQPFLEVLIGKTIEQALLEVIDEEELANLRQQQQALEEIHNAELTEIARLEDRNQRYVEEKQRRLKQYEISAGLAKETARKIAAQAFTKSYLAPLLKNTYEELLERGYFYDSTEIDIETHFFDSLVNAVLDSMEHERSARLLLDGLLREVVCQRHTEFRELSRSIYEEKCINEVLPLLRQDVAIWIIQHYTVLTISCLQLTPEVMGILKEEVISEIENSLVNKLTVEVEVQKEITSNDEQSEDC